MGGSVYIWRKLTSKQQAELLGWRKRQGLPWHRPPHRASEKARYHVTAACFEHRPFIGLSRERMEGFSNALLAVLNNSGARIHAWCVLPNHYHALMETTAILEVLADLGRMHGRLSFDWNGQEQTRGRQVWCGAAERYMRNDRHFWATINYVHNNPVHHGYVRCWQDWPYSSAPEYLAEMGRNEAKRIWKEYPVLGYGKNGMTQAYECKHPDGWTPNCSVSTLQRAPGQPKGWTPSTVPTAATNALTRVSIGKSDGASMV